MQKSITIKYKGQELVLKFNLRNMIALERDVKRSVTDVVEEAVAKQNTAMINIDFLVAALVHGIQNLKVTDDIALDIIQNYCDYGGTLYLLQNDILASLLLTGLFTKGVQTPTAQPQEVVPAAKEDQPADVKG